MENILNSGAEFIELLQSLGTWLAPIMKFFTFLGNEQFYLLVAPAILWCIDSVLGLRLSLFLMISGAVNTTLKMSFHDPRPYWFTNDFTFFGGVENSFGLPSGHAQNAVVVWGTLANRLKKSWAWVLCILVMFLIGISRIYLAIHFPTDVLAGWLVGAILLLAFHYFEGPVSRFVSRYSHGMQIGMMFIFSAIMIVLILLIRLLYSGWALPADWTNNASLAFPDAPKITPFSLYSTLSAPAAFFGLASGWIWLQARNGFAVKGELWQLLARYALGVAGVLFLYSGLGKIFPRDEALIAYILRYMRYAAIGFWITGLAPWLFVKLKLANHSQ